MPTRRAKRPSLPEQTNELWPHRLHELRNRDSRLREYLEHLAATMLQDKPEPLLWVICCGVWWLEPHEAREMAELVKEMLESRPSY